MAYSPKGVMDIYDILTRWHAGYPIAHIAVTLGVDRKTVRRYVRAAEDSGLSKETPLPERDVLLERLRTFVPSRPRWLPARDQFEPYRDEILELISRTTDPLKPKTAYEVLCQRHGLEASYSTFKRFMRALGPAAPGRRTTCRFETEPGQELQLDYGKMGRLFDEQTGRQRDVYAFIGTLSYSRYKFIEFVYKQDQKSFVGSHTRMFAFFGGVAQCLVIDNLKSGVLKPDRYDPVLNPLYRELAGHYGCFIDTARVRAPRDKGKIERVVPLARELFRKLKTLHPRLDLAEANRLALDWCRFDNGTRVHGTTGEPPAEVFAEREQPALQGLSASPFEMVLWKQVTVHADQYIQFEKQTYSVPTRFVCHKLWARGTETLVQLFDEDFRLVKQYVRTARLRHTDPTDFPEHIRPLLHEQPTVGLMERAALIGPHMKAYITRVLNPPAKINLRKAQGMLRLADPYGREQLEAAASFALTHHLFTYQAFKQLLADSSLSDGAAVSEDLIPISAETADLLRDVTYFIHANS